MSATPPTFETIEISLSSTGVAEIALNRPKRYNALSEQAYKDWLDALTWAASSENVKIAILTGRGKYYTSGQELVMPDLSDNNLLANTKRRHQITSNLIETMIQFPKLLIAAVNGPAIGFGATTLALCDVVYAVPEATFTTPFMKLGYCAEGCSSVLFPRIMGPSRASELLMMGKTFTAQDMIQCGLVSRTFPSATFRESVLAEAEATAQFSLEALTTTKKLVRENDTDLLIKTNRREMEKLLERMMSSDAMERLVQFAESARKRKAAKL